MVRAVYWSGSTAPPAASASCGGNTRRTTRALRVYAPALRRAECLGLTDQRLESLLAESPHDALGTARPGDKWHMDEVFIRIQGVQHYLWRAVDQDGVVLDILVQTRRDAQAANRFFKRLLKGLHYEPRVIVTDKLRSYGVAQRQLLPASSTNRADI
jgi:hypothetical protein